MSKAFWIDDHILSPLGDGSLLNFEKILAGETGLNRNPAPKWVNNHPIAFISEENQNPNFPKDLTRFERLIIYSIEQLLKKSSIQPNKKTLMVISSTKGNIGHLNTANASDSKTFSLASSAKKIQAYFKLENEIIIVSNACISGALALSIANDFLSYSDIENVIVCGADEITPFIYSGFQSFHALSEENCKPFDQNRTGLNLGEAIGSVLLSKNPKNAKAKLVGFGSVNDANHISGPSRTGEGLFRSVLEIKENLENPESFKPDFISAHGTATPYNDEMEAIAIGRLGLEETPVHSLKGNYGHTLGASALIESILGVYSLVNNILIPTIGFKDSGTSIALNIIKKPTKFEGRSFLKLASGFGGCNIACLIEKTNPLGV